MAVLESKYMAILNNLSPNSLCLHLFLCPSKSRVAPSAPMTLSWQEAMEERLMDSNPDASLDFEILRDTRTGDLFVWAPQAGCPIHLRFLDSIPGDPDGVLTYDVRTFLRLRRSGILESVAWQTMSDA